MPYVFALGVGRSGTTLLGRMLAATSTPARFVNELCPGIPDRIPSRRFAVEPGDSETAARVRETIVELAAGRSPFGEAYAHRLERNDPDAAVLIVKDVHSLLAYPEIVAGLDDWRAVVITRDTLRSLDSYFHGHRPAQRRYLVDDYAYVARHIGTAAAPASIARATASVPPGVARYFRRPRIFTSELFRQAAITELVVRHLRAWAGEDARVVHVRFEDLCRNPLAESMRLFGLLRLEADDRTGRRIQRMTTGSSSAYYATDKDSARVLEQPFKYLGARQRRRLKSFLDPADPRRSLPLFRSRSAAASHEP